MESGVDCMIDNIIVGLVILAVVGAAAAYIIRAKKKGAKCVGCPDSGTCSCHCSEKSK